MLLAERPPVTELAVGHEIGQRMVLSRDDGSHQIEDFLVRVPKALGLTLSLGAVQVIPDLIRVYVPDERGSPCGDPDPFEYLRIERELGRIVLLGSAIAVLVGAFQAGAALDVAGDIAKTFPAQQIGFTHEVHRSNPAAIDQGVTSVEGIQGGGLLLIARQGREVGKWDIQAPDDLLLVA